MRCSRYGCWRGGSPGELPHLVLKGSATRRRGVQGGRATRDLTALAEEIEIRLRWADGDVRSGRACHAGTDSPWRGDGDSTASGSRRRAFGGGGHTRDLTAAGEEMEIDCVGAH